MSGPMEQTVAIGVPMPNKSADGALATWRKVPPTPTEQQPALNRGIQIGHGFDSTSRSVIVVWLMNRTVRDVSGAWSLEKNAAVRALATAPSIAKPASPIDDRRQHAGFNTHPRIRRHVDDGDDRILAGEAAAALSSNCTTSACVMIGGHRRAVLISSIPADPHQRPRRNKCRRSYI
jgi:hypothetical protein